MRGKYSQQQDEQYLVPMEITLEAACDFGIDPKDLICFPFGSRKCQVYLVPASREVYLAYMQPVWAEAMRVSWEQNKCESLDALVEQGAEPAEEHFEDDIVHSILAEELAAMLTEIRPKYGGIFSMLCDGAAQQELADKLGIEPQAVLDDIRKLRRILWPLVQDAFDR